MNTTRPQLFEERYPPFVRVTLRRWAKLYSGGAEVFWPFTDLFVRFAVAQFFIRSGLVKFGNWDTALLLATQEYPVPWMAPATAAALGLAIELIGPVLLVLGLFTRPAAIAMGTLTIVAQAYYIPTTTNLFLIAMLIWYAIYGPAAFSLDRLFASGLRNSAIPLASQMARVGDFLREKVAPVAMLAIRLWLALSMFASLGYFEPSIALATWLPLGSFAGIPDWLVMVFAVMLVIGWMTSLVAFVLLLAIGAVVISGIHPDITFYPVLLLAIYDGRGPGFPSVDGAFASWMEKHILFDREYKDIPDDWPHIVVIGAGFGGLAAVNRLKRLPVRITLIDKHNYHLFQPLLYQIASATLNPADIAVPIRSLFKDDGNVRVIKGDVSAIDSEGKSVSFGSGQSVSFDRLVIATGASHSYFGNEDWGKFAPGLKTIEDGVAVRGAILDAFEQAEASDDPDRIRRLLNFVIVGGGATGVELAGAIAELAKVSVEREFRTVDPASARVVLVQSGERILPQFPEELSAKATASLEDLEVEVRTNSRVTSIAADHVKIGDDERIETETVLWAAGVIASPAAQWLGAEADRAGKVIVDEHLRAEGHDDIFVIGDTAASLAWDGDAVPGLAPAAKQAGTHVAKIVEAQLLGKDEPAPFVYKHRGSLATIGRKAAVADIGRWKLSGSFAWWLWGVIHVGFLTGARNRAAVVMNWVWSFFASHSGVRLITGPK
ncbi:MAG: FAD-dependent oxidoreductase [Erythrobacter sp.]